MIDNETLETIKPYLPSYKVLSVTKVGSQMWQMADLSSDHDMIIIYQEPTYNILSGKMLHPTLPSKHHIMLKDVVGNEQEYDFSYLEIGHFCNQLKKGNVNMIWALLSPIIVIQDPAVRVLRDMIYKTHTADIVSSGLGMTESQLRDVVKRAAMRSPEKSLKTAYRTTNFLFNHLRNGEWKFESCNKTVTESDVRDLMDQVKDLQLNNNLNSMPVERIEHWLYMLRVCDT